MRLPLRCYNTLVFDCDGVVLDSNKVKTQAFYKAVLPYGPAAAQALVGYHVANGGVSRYEKFAYFLNTLVPEYAPAVDGPDFDALLRAYASEIHHGLLHCKVAEGLNELRETTTGTRWLIVSGGDQSELRAVFEQRGLSDLFEGGIFGSPDTKGTILSRELEKGNITLPALFIGDSTYDYQASNKVGLDFIFVKCWTEVEHYECWLAEKNINAILSLKDLNL